jgi:hypothetical protein
MPTARAMATSAQRGPGVGAREAEMLLWTTSVPTEPGPSAHPPQGLLELTVDPGDDPGHSCGANWGQSAVWTWCMAHVPVLLDCRR